MADEDKDSKTEKPTEKKLRDTMEKGNVPHSREATIFASMLATVIYVTFFLPERVGRMGEVLRDLFEKPDQWQLETGPDAIALLTRIGWEIGNMVLPAGVSASMFQNLPTPVLERIRPQFSRISPVAGFKRIFSATGMVEFGKSLTKIVLVSIVMFFVLRSQYFHAMDSLVSDPQTIFVRLSTIVQRILILVLLATIVVGIADLLWSRHHWFDQLKMTKQEVKDEHKQSQGDPIVKSRQRSIARDRARRRMMKQVPRATLVIANPTHFAVALRYVREESDAPIVVAKGQDLIALKIREIAEANNIPVFEDPPLARSMFAQVSVDSVIPSVFYKAVAELIHRIYAAQSNRKRVR